MKKELDDLAALENQRALIDAEIRQKVATLRRYRAYWKDIGAALNVTAQAAQQRYAARR